MKRINKVIKVLIISDFFLNSAWGLFSPVFAIFVVQNITGGDTIKAAEVAGFGALFYWVVKSILQIPIGRYLDKTDGESDDFMFMFLGLLIASLVPFGFLFSTTAWHTYIFQILHAIGMAMMIPSWYAIFTRHIDKGKEAFEWGLDSTILGIGAGITGAAGGLLAVLGFHWIFIFSGVFNLISAIILLLIARDISPKKKTASRFPPIISPF